jgi:hypothetical protein
VGEVVEERDDVPPTGVCGVRLDYALEELDLVEGRFRVVGGRFDDLEGDVLVDPVAREGRDGRSAKPDGSRSRSLLSPGGAKGVGGQELDVLYTAGSCTRSRGENPAALLAHDLYQRS